MGFVSVEEISKAIKALRNFGARQKQGLKIHGAIDGHGMNRVYSKIFCDKINQ